MSLGIVVKGTEGVVLAADSRVTLSAQLPNGSTLPVNFDNATKLIHFGAPHDFMAALNYGQALIGRRTANSYIQEIERTLGDSRLSIEQYAKRLGVFFAQKWVDAKMPVQSTPGLVPMIFIVAGYDKGEDYGSVYLLSVPNSPDPQPQNAGQFGMTWGGQLEVANRIIHGYDPALESIIKAVLNLDDSQMAKLVPVLQANLAAKIPYDMLPLQDCIDLASFLINATIRTQSLSVAVRGVGGEIELAVITREKGFEQLHEKHLHA